MILSHLSKQQIIYYPLQKVTEAEAIYSKLSGPGVLITCRKAVKLTLIAPLIPSEAGAAVELRIRVSRWRSCVCERTRTRGEEINVFYCRLFNYILKNRI